MAPKTSTLDLHTVDVALFLFLFYFEWAVFESGKVTKCELLRSKAKQKQILFNTLHMAFAIPSMWRAHPVQYTAHTHIGSKIYIQFGSCRNIWASFGIYTAQVQKQTRRGVCVCSVCYVSYYFYVKNGQKKETKQKTEDGRW